ncbi:MAG: YfhO family protein [Syntrophales bacterium LBB04]|nr:YfhO family protein [Syntrophales bacterium LBB04]
MLFQEHRSGQNTFRIKVFHVSIALLALLAAQYLFSLSQNPEHVRILLSRMGYIYSGKTLINATIFFALAVKKIFVLSVIFAIYPFIKLSRIQKAFFIILILLHFADMSCYFSHETIQRTTAMDKQTQALFEFRPMTFEKRRSNHFINSPQGRLAYNSFFKKNTTTWAMDAFLMQDEASTYRRTEYCLAPLYEYFLSFSKSKNGKLLLDHLVPTLKLPRDYPGIMRISAVAEDKIQFFDKAFILNDAAWHKRIFGDKQYAGNLLFLSPSEQQLIDRLSAENWTGKESLSVSHRLHLPYTIRRFNANQIDITVDAPEGKEIWMMYSDVFHPKWHVTVNGQSQKIMRGNIAYKAVRLMPGHNRVEFRYKSPLLVLLNLIIGMNAFLWICYMFREIFRIYEQSPSPSVRERTGI